MSTSDDDDDDDKDFPAPGGGPVATVELDVSTRDPNTALSVVDSSLATLASGVERLSVRLPPGIYKIRAGVGVHVVERLVALLPGSPPVSVAFDAIRFSSSAPLEDTSRTHEYHIAAADDAGAGVAASLGTGSSILVFARKWSPAGEAAAELDIRDLVLAEANGPGHVMIHDNGHWVGSTDPACACNVSAQPGPYVLTATVGGERLSLPIISSPGWQTQVFLLQSADCDNKLDLGNASIFYVRPGKQSGYGFRADSSMLRRIELARLALRNGQSLLSTSDTMELADGKFENPMLGVLAAHLLLMQRDPAHAGLLATIVANLRRLFVAPHPDVEALALVLDPHHAQEIHFSFPPMLVRSWALVLKASIAAPGIVPAGSLAAKAAGRLWGPSSWLIWKDARERIAKSASSIIDVEQLLSRLRPYGRDKLLTLPELDASEEALIDLITPLERRRAQRSYEPSRDVLELVNERDIGLHLGLPPSTVGALLDGLVTKAEATHGLRPPPPLPLLIQHDG